MPAEHGICTYIQSRGNISEELIAQCFARSGTAELEHLQKTSGREKPRQGMYDNADVFVRAKMEGRRDIIHPPPGYGSDESFFPFFSNGVRSLSPRARLVFLELGRDPFGTGVLTPLKIRRSGIPPPRTRTLSNPDVAWCCSGGMTGVFRPAWAVLAPVLSPVLEEEPAFELMLAPLVLLPLSATWTAGAPSIVFCLRACRRRSITPAGTEFLSFRLPAPRRSAAARLTGNQRCKFAFLGRTARRRTDDFGLGVDVLESKRNVSQLLRRAHRKPHLRCTSRSRRRSGKRRGRELAPCGARSQDLAQRDLPLPQSSPR